MTNEHNVTVGGAIVYWTLSDDFDAELLKTGLQNLGLEKFAPDARTTVSALKQALINAAGLCKLKNVLVRGLENPKEDGFIVVRENLGDQDNEYDTLFHADHHPSEGLRLQCDDPNFCAHTQNEFRKCSGSASAYAVSKSLVNIAAELHGTPLRPSGGIYWIPDHKLSQWEDVVKVVSAAAHGETKLYKIRTVFDDSAADALRDAVANAINSDVKALEEYTKKDNAKERFLRARREDAKRLREKVKSWEEVLNLTLGDLREVTKDCEQHVVDVAIGEFPDIFGAADVLAEELAEVTT